MAERRATAQSPRDSLGECGRLDWQFVVFDALDDGVSNPHHGAGYLIHPKVIKLVTNWLAS